MIYVTGGAGFIGSNFIKFLNKKNITDITIVDILSDDERWKNLIDLQFCDIISPKNLLESHLFKLSEIYHFGAISSTTEKNAGVLIENNTLYTKNLIDKCHDLHIPLVYASSASVYGSGIYGFSDIEDIKYMNSLRPLNPYAFSKLLVDKWVVGQKLNNHVTGLRFFNVWGAKESHKGSQASLISRITNNIIEEKTITLFTHADKKLSRDFIYVGEVCQIVYECMKNKITGIYNVGTGVDTEWKTLVDALALELGKPAKIELTNIPETLLSQYQFTTCANMEKLSKKIQLPKFDLNANIRDYLKEL